MGGFRLTLGSVGDQHRFSRLDEVAASSHQSVERRAVESRILLLGDKQGVEEVLLLARARSELAADRLLHAEAGLIGTAAGLMRVEVGDGGESVEKGLAVVTRTPLEQFGQAVDRVEGPRRETVGFSRRPTSEQRASVSRSDRDLVRDGQRLLELSGHADKLVDGLLHVLNLGEEVLAVTHLEAELAAGVTHDDCERVRADDAGRRVDPVEVGRTVDAVEQRETVLEVTVPNLERIQIGAELHRNETAATVIDRASGFDGCARTANGVLNDLPEAGVGDGRIGIRNGNADRLAIVAAPEVAPAFQRSVVGDEEGETLDVIGESVLKLNDGNDLGEAVPSLFDSSLNVAIFEMSCHSIFSFLQCVEVDRQGECTGCGGILQAEMRFFFGNLFCIPLGDGDRNCANLDLDEQK